jgi:hypothetical protein
VPSNIFGVSSSSSLGCVGNNGFEVCIDDGFVGVGVCVGDGELALDSLMEGFSFAITTDCFSEEAFSFGKK